MKLRKKVGARGERRHLEKQDCSIMQLSFFGKRGANVNSSVPVAGFPFQCKFTQFWGRQTAFSASVGCSLLLSQNNLYAKAGQVGAAFPGPLQY